MPASIPALVTPAVLKWARKESGYDPERAAKQAGVPPEKLLAWEEEETEAKPTLRQAQALAKFYHRPLGVFFLPQPPSLPPLAAEYRRLPGIEPGAESPELRTGETGTFYFPAGADPAPDTSAWEREIDERVFRLYGLTPKKSNSSRRADLEQGARLLEEVRTRR